MRNRYLAGLSVAVTMGVAIGIPPGAPAGDAPPAAAPPAAEPASSYDARRTNAERVANEVGYREHIAGSRQYLLEKHLGQWVVIAGGRAFPVNESRTAVRPAATMEEADAAARAEVPDARHRFVFRIGEEGDLHQQLGGAELSHVLGNWFLAELERPDVVMRGLGPGQDIQFVKGDARIEITVKGPDDRMFVRPEVGAPGAAGRAEEAYVLSTGFGGYAVLAATTAVSGSLHLWEVPGKIAIDGVFQKGECRRARARFRFPGTDLDLLIPVAVWPETP
jgi:hypothetical protein